MLHLNSFGEQQYRTQDCDVVEVCLGRAGCQEIEICALGFPVLCLLLPNKIEVKFPHLDGLEFAREFDESDDESDDILIGSDYYWEKVNGETVHGESGPTAVKNELDPLARTSRAITLALIWLLREGRLIIQWHPAITNPAITKTPLKRKTFESPAELQ